jgi:AbrB family looped-hinge helix DNA binding protein
MEATVDNAGRVLIPKPLREALGIGPGVKVDISEYGAGLTIIPGGRVAQVIDGKYGRKVLHGSTIVTMGWMAG